MKIYNESLSRGKYIYFGKRYILKKKEKANLVIPIEKNQDPQLVGQKKKNTVKAAMQNVLIAKI